MLDSHEDRRSALIRGLVEGTLPLAEAAAAARSHGLLPSATYRAIRARPGAGTGPLELARAVAATGGANGHGALATALEGEVIAIVSGVPRIPDGAVAGVGAPAALWALDSSFRLATRALETALAYGLEGVVDIDDLSLRPAILTEPHLGERLVLRYIAPLMELGPFGETLRHTVHEYLDSGMRIHRAAEALYIHPNTLRYRLERFEEVTSANLGRTQDLLELWWALERHRLDLALNREE